MAIGYGVVVPKGKTRKQLKARKDREDAKQLREFRSAVWAREHQRWFGFHEGQLAKCEECQTLVYPTMEPLGHVHHIASRRHKSTRYAIENGRLLCRTCHNAVHGREF